MTNTKYLSLAELVQKAADEVRQIQQATTAKVFDHGDLGTLQLYDTFIRSLYNAAEAGKLANALPGLVGILDKSTPLQGTTQNDKNLITYQVAKGIWRKCDKEKGSHLLTGDGYAQRIRRAIGEGDITTVVRDTLGRIAALDKDELIEAINAYSPSRAYHGRKKYKRKKHPEKQKNPRKQEENHPGFAEVVECISRTGRDIDEVLAEMGITGPTAQGYKGAYIKYHASR